MNGVKCSGRVREHRQVEPQEPVGAHLQQHAGKDDAARGGGLDVRVRQPGVEREHRDLYGERQEEREEHPVLELRPGNAGPSA